MQDSDTAVGRLLNPYNVGDYSPGGARELYYHGLGSPYKSTPIAKGEEDSVGLIADAYIKDAEKRGTVHPDEDRIAKNYKIIEDLKKRKNLEHIPIREDTFLGDAWGKYIPESKEILIDNSLLPFNYTIDPNRKREKASSFSERIQAVLKGNEPGKGNYEQEPLSEQRKKQKLMNDRHLNTTIHELRHAEDYQNYPEEAGNWAHFKGARSLLNEKDDNDGVFYDEINDAGKIYDIEQAALQRLANMGKEKK